MMQRVLVALCLFALLFTAGEARADLRKGSSMLIAKATYVWMQNSPSGQTNSGTGGGLSWEKLSADGDWTAGLMFDYFDSDESYLGPNQEDISAEYRNILFHVKARYFFDVGATFKLYTGISLGFRFASFDIVTDGIPFEDSESNFSMGIPLGLDIFLGDKFFLDINYTFNFLSGASYLQHDIVNAANVGLGFQWGGGDPESVPDERSGAEPEPTPATEETSEDSEGGI